MLMQGEWGSGICHLWADLHSDSTYAGFSWGSSAADSGEYLYEEAPVAASASYF